MDHNVEAIVSVQAPRLGITIVCACGWQSAPYPTEDEARLELDLHLIAVGAK